MLCNKKINKIKGIVAHSVVVQSPVSGKHEISGLTARKQRERWMLILSSFLLFIQSKTQDHEMVLPEFKFQLNFKLNLNLSRSSHLN